LFVISREAIVDALTELVRIPSINPDLVSGADGERAVADAIAARLRRTPGIEVELQGAGDGRPNVIAVTGSGPGRTLMLNGHTDVVGIAGMDDPWSARVEGNRLYGRGSSDMKGALAVALVLLEAVARAGDFPGRLVVTFVVDEEYASIGTAAICREIERWNPDAALVLEGTDLHICTAHKGFAWAEIVTHGFAAHGSAFEIGVDAIAHMGRVIVALEAYARDLVSRPPHPLVGPPSVHASLIAGGQELSSYPEECRLQIERRTIPGETEEQVRAELQAILDRESAADPTFKGTLAMGVYREPFGIAPEADIVQTLKRVVTETLGTEPAYVGGSGWMDSAFLSSAGVPTAVFGPSGEGAHGLVEWVDLDSLDAFARALTAVAYTFCAEE
jgi:acetylornithine deacetylase